MWRFWTCSQVGVLSIAIFLTSGWNNILSKCYLKVSKGMAIWTSSIDTSLMGTYTCSTKFKLVDGIKLIGCSNMINVGTSMVPIF